MNSCRAECDFNRLSWLTILGVSIALFIGCSKKDQYPNRPILLVCPWAAGGGTDRVSRTIAAHLEGELGTAVNVINATGGKGVTGHSRAINARPDGYTIGMATLELNMMHWSGLTSLDVDSCQPLISVNEDYAALFVLADAPWQTLAELEADIRENPKTLTASGTSSGGAWHLAIAGWLIESGLNADDIVWVSSTGSGPSLQDLISGGIDMVCCSLPEAATLYKAGKIRALGVMSPARAKGYEEVATFAEQGTNWSLGGWRALAIPKGTPEEVQRTLLEAFNRIVTGQTTVSDVTFPEFMEKSGFDHTYRTGEQLDEFLRETDQKFGELLTSEAMQSVNQDPFNPMTFPYIIVALMGAAIIGIVIQSARNKNDVSDEKTKLQITPHGVVSCLLVLMAIGLYAALAETVGFVIIALIILCTLGIWMGVRPWVAILLSIAFTVGIYQLFTTVLRVPLPRGWFGW
ncbi:MAG: hypothetical protein GY768_32345 [Planctomycetaceae bacterium]|nr:hypothetical protein [Planctomycetaceae bacterium]